MIVSGPFVDVKGSQSRPYAVSLYVPGRIVEIHRFGNSTDAQLFADNQRRETR